MVDFHMVNDLHIQEAIFHHFETPLFETPNKVKRREPAFSNVGLRQGFILTPELRLL